MLKLKINNLFLGTYRFHLAVVIFVVGFFLLPRIPYLNLFLTYSVPFLLWMSAIIALGLRGPELIRFGVVLFLTILLFTLFGENFYAEIAGNAAYFILLTGFALIFWQIIKTK